MEEVTAGGGVRHGVRGADRTREYVTAALFAALLAASAWVAVPLGGGVPLTFQTFVVLLAGLVLTARGAVAAVGVYLLLGAAGIPVFAGVRGGLGVLLGPTGGYLWGFLLAALLVAVLAPFFTRRGAAHLAEPLALGWGVAVIYLLGWAQLMVVTGMGATAAAVAGVLPFIGLDAAKAVAAFGLAGALRRAGVVR